MGKEQPEEDEPFDVEAARAIQDVSMKIAAQAQRTISWWGG